MIKDITARQLVFADTGKIHRLEQRVLFDSETALVHKVLNFNCLIFDSLAPYRFSSGPTISKMERVESKKKSPVCAKNANTYFQNGNNEMK